MEIQTILSTIGVMALVTNALLLACVLVAVIVLYRFLKKTKQDAQAIVEASRRIAQQTGRRLSFAGGVAKIIAALRTRPKKEDSSTS
jgi:hypothetical protein